jgi:hypothetical protein
MYIGHFSFALAIRGRRSRLPLGLCLIASVAPDFVAIVVDLARSDLYSHSLVSVAVLALAGALLSWAYLRDAGDSFWVGALVVSHLPADWLTSRLALWPGGPVWGAELYARPGVDFVLESALAVVGWVIYRRSLPEAAARRPLAWAPLGALLALQAGWNIVSSR